MPADTFTLLAKSPDDAVVAALEDAGRSLLNAVRKGQPLVRVEGTVQVGAVAGLKETAGTDVEPGRNSSELHRVQYTDLVGDAVLVGVEHEPDAVNDKSVDVTRRL